jgi:hypothetical protein
MRTYKQQIQELEEMPKERNSFFIQVRFDHVIEQFKK